MLRRTSVTCQPKFQLALGASWPACVNRVKQNHNVMGRQQRFLAGPGARFRARNLVRIEPDGSIEIDCDRKNGDRTRKGPIQLDRALFGRMFWDD